MTILKLGMLMLGVAAVGLASVSAQKADKTWLEWSKKDAQKILDESPWGQVQIDTDTSQMFYSPTQDPQRMGTSSNDSSRLSQGATNQAVNVKYHVRFFSARPVRQALARLMLLNQQPPEVVTKLHNFAELKDDNSIIITVLYESNDQRYGNTVMQTLNSAVTATLKNNVYLERNDGKRLFLEEYIPPGKDGFGARFIFLRNPEDKPFLDASIREVRFYAEYPHSNIKVDRRFKLADMMYQGELEY